MKVIFLDFDGVLNNPKFMKGAAGFGESQIDPSAVQRLNRLVASTGSKIVISSSWRHIWSVEEIGRMLSRAGFKFSSSIIDRTPIGESSRGQEIQEWLDLDPEREVVNPNHESVESFVILDDNNDMLPDQQSKFIHVNGLSGMTDRDVDEAISILRMKL